MRQKPKKKAFTPLEINDTKANLRPDVSSGLSLTGFTLVEIMIVITILGILAALTIPNLLRARHNADEAAAITAVRTISVACENYRAAQTPVSYPPDLNTLTTVTPPYIDSVLAGATSSTSTRHGYYFTFNWTNANQYTCTATPQTSGLTGTRVFYVDETGVIRLNNSVGAPVE